MCLTTACSSAGSSSGSAPGGSEPQSLTFSVPVANTTENAYQALADLYMKAHPGVTIKVNSVNLSSYNSTLTTSLQAGNGPDLFYVNPGSGEAGSVDQLGKAGQLMALADSTSISGLPAADADLFKVNSKVYAYPVDLDTAGIIYNDEAAQADGIKLTGNSTFSDLLAACKTAKSKGKALLGLAGSAAPNTAYLSMELAGSTVYGPTPDWNAQRKAGKTTFAGSDGWKAALDGIKTLYTSGCFQNGAAGAGFDALTNGMSQGKIFGFFAPGGGASDIMKAAQGHVKLIILPFPSPSGPTLMTAAPADAIAGNAKTKSPKLVADFLSWFVQKPQAITFANTKGDLPVGDVKATELLPQYAGIADVIVAKKYVPLGYQQWPNGRVYNTLGEGVTGLLTGQKTTADILKAMDQAWDN